jgi:hypothetical protein
VAEFFLLKKRAAKMLQLSGSAENKTRSFYYLILSHKKALHRLRKCRKWRFSIASVALNIIIGSRLRLNSD